MMQFKHWTLAAVMLAAGSALATDLNGVELGSQPSLKTLYERLGSEKQFGLYPVAGRYTGTMNIGDCPVVTHVTIDTGGLVAMLEASFPPSCFDELASEAILKWGKPTKSGTATLSNDYRASVLAVEHDWITEPEHARISLINYDPVLTNTLHVRLGSLTLETDIHSLAEKARRNAGRPDGNI
jgi:hypothetical protein